MDSRLHLGYLSLAMVMGGAAHAKDLGEAPQPQAFVDSMRVVDEERWRVADGWSNGDWTANDWRASQIRHDDDGAVITLARARFSEKPYTSGELQSEEVFQYGYFETRMQVPRGSGLVTGFFTYARPAEENSWDEIDIEILGRDTRSIQLTYFGQGDRHITMRPLPFDAAEGQHTYGFEWAPDAIRWYVDGQLIHEETGEHAPLPQSPQRLYLHMWNTQTLNDWLGPIVPGEGPWRLLVSCIAYAPTYGGAPLCDGAPAGEAAAEAPDAGRGETTAEPEANVGTADAAERGGERRSIWRSIWSGAFWGRLFGRASREPAHDETAALH